MSQLFLNWNLYSCGYTVISFVLLGFFWVLVSCTALLCSICDLMSVSPSISCKQQCMCLEIETKCLTIDLHFESMSLYIQIQIILLCYYLLLL